VLWIISPETEALRGRNNSVQGEIEGEMLWELKRKASVRKHGDRFWNGRRLYWCLFQWGDESCLTDTLELLISIVACAYHRWWATHNFVSCRKLMETQMICVHTDTKKFVLQLISAWWKTGFQKFSFYFPEAVGQFCQSISKFIPAVWFAYKCVCFSKFSFIRVLSSCSFAL
jgi:hypothetical protein